MGWLSFTRYQRELYDCPKASLLSFKVRMVKSDVVEALLYGCASWALLKIHYKKLRAAHTIRYCFESLGAWCRPRDDRILSYNDVLQRIGCESIRDHRPMSGLARDRTTGLDCAVMCNLRKTHTRTSYLYKHKCSRRTKGIKTFLLFNISTHTVWGICVETFSWEHWLLGRKAHMRF